MKLRDFQLLPKSNTGFFGNQAVLDFGKYHLSIIDDGYGSKQGLYEIAVFNANDGVANDFVRLPGITAENDDVFGHLTEDAVDAIIIKLFTLTGVKPVQI
jgi:hypothetical protein